MCDEKTTPEEIADRLDLAMGPEKYQAEYKLPDGGVLAVTRTIRRVKDR